MARPVRADVQGVLEPYHRRIRRIVEEAWAEWRAVDGFRKRQKFGPVLYPRTVANYIFDAIARLAIKEFADDSSVHVEIEAQTIKIVFKSVVLARFKKGDDDKLGQNIPTQSVLAFIDADGIFPGMPPETSKVEFIWLANEIHTRLEHVLVVARDGDELLWDYEIGPADEAGATIIEFPAPPLAPTPSDDDKLVTPKKPDIKKTEEKE